MKKVISILFALLPVQANCKFGWTGRTLHPWNGLLSCDRRDALPSWLRRYVTKTGFCLSILFSLPYPPTRAFANTRFFCVTQIDTSQAQKCPVYRGFRRLVFCEMLKPPKSGNWRQDTLSLCTRRYRRRIVWLWIYRYHKFEVRRCGNCTRNREV